ncbi:MAG: metallophosphoesterase [Bacteroidales bacterium]|nr:metallophosphoesterase [Bacteroidales bacterium]
MDRRSFFKISAAGLAGLALPGELALGMGPKSIDGKYSVVILGDTHYDDADPLKYHKGYTDPSPERLANHQREFVRNGQMWAGRSKDLVKRAACLVDDDTRYVFQMGDLIQGDTADAATHKRFLEDALNLFKNDLAPDLPFVTVAGNHDLRGNDDAVCTQAYTEYMSERMSRELGQEINGTNFLFRCGPDAFVVVNFTKPKVNEITALLEQARGARHVFVIVHSPVFPFDHPKYYWWYLLGNRKDSKAEERRKMRALLASLNAIVLCGHTHATEFMDWRGDGGRITQMTMSSVWRTDSQATYRELASGADEYCTLLFKAKPELATEANKALFDEYRAGIREYSTSDAAGSYKLIVDGPRVYVDFYAGDSSRLSKRFTLR